MDGTVNWASLEDGRPALAGAEAVDATVAGTVFSADGLLDTGDFDLGGTVVCIGLADVFEAGILAELASARGLEVEEGVDLAAGLAAGLALALTAGFATFSTVLAEGFAAGLETSAAFAAGFSTGFATALVTALTAGLAAALTGFPFGSALA